MKTYIDLHIHSTASDGTLTPTEIVQTALKSTKSEKDPIVIALTDHDTVAGVSEFLKEAKKIKKESLPFRELKFQLIITELKFIFLDIMWTRKTKNYWNS